MYTFGQAVDWLMEIAGDILISTRNNTSDLPHPRTPTPNEENNPPTPPNTLSDLDILDDGSSQHSIRYAQVHIYRSCI